MLAAQGDIGGALSEYRSCKEIAETQVGRNPKVWEAVLAVSCTRVGEMLAAQGDSRGALKENESAMELAKSAADRGITMLSVLLALSQSIQ